MPLYTSRLQLAELSMNALQRIHLLHSMPAVDKFNTLGIPKDIAATERLLQEWMAMQACGMRYIYCMELKDSHQFIGLIGLNMGKPNYLSAETWYKTDPAFWNKGYTSEALACILHLGFHTLKLHRIEAGCAVNNMASIRVLEKAGFTKEGRTRELLPIRGPMG